MKSTSHTQLCAIALTCALASCSSQTSEVTRVSVSSTSGSDRSISGQIFTGVNSYRSQKGKKALKRHSGLDRIAQRHCEYLLRTSNGNGLKINHNGFDGRASEARFSFSIPSIAENVVASSTHSASHLVNLWISSKTHEYNMRASWVYTGIGTIVTPDGKLISTQVFGTAEQGPMTGVADPFARFQ